MTEIEKLKQENAEPEHQLEECEKPRPVRLKILRKKNKLTQRAMAEKFNLPKTTYTQYEMCQGKCLFGFLRKLVEIADAFNVSLDWLCGRTDKMSGV